MNVLSFERAVWEIEGIRITIRAPKSARVEPYSFSRQASSNTTLSSWRDNRVLNQINDLEVDIVDGLGNVPHGSTLLGNLRKTYA